MRNKVLVWLTSFRWSHCGRWCFIVLMLLIAFGNDILAVGIVAASFWTRDTEMHVSRTRVPPALLAAGQAAYERGDSMEALEILHPLAEAGDPEAQYLIGSLYGGVSGLPADACEETKWYDRAARQGHPQAQYLLAFSYLRGRGVFEDDAKAYRWALAASRNGVANATEKLSYFSKDLSTAERQAIDREMATWRPEDEPPAWIIRIPDLPFFANPRLGPEPCYDLF